MSTQSIPTSSDCIEYYLHIDNMSLPTDAEELQRRKDHIMDFIQPLIKDYIWQYEPFQLHLDQADELFYLYGSTNFDDYIDDEWYIVHLLFEISKKYNDVSVCVLDDSGQFLLVEAAYVIPKWIKPSNADHRVWIRNGRLHVIPKPINPSEFSILPSGKDLTLEKALNILKEQPVNTHSSGDIENCIVDRISLVVDNISDSQYHYATCFIPVEIAYLFKKHPQMVANAVTSFYHRDILQMKKCNNPSTFNVSESNSVMSRVRFTRCLFAQSIRQTVNRPPTAFKIDKRADDFKAKDLGMKLSCGMQILYNEESRKRRKYKNTTQNMNVESYEFDEDPQFHQFLLSLRKLGFFGNEMDGSKEYQRLEMLARHNYLDRILEIEYSISDNYADIIDNLLKVGEEENYLLNEFIAEPPLPDSSEEWLEISPEEIDKILLEKQVELDSYYDSGSEKPMNEDNIFDSLVNNMKGFIENISDYEGIDFDDEDAAFSASNFDLNELSKLLSGEKKFEYGDSESSDEGDEFYDGESSDTDLEETMGVIDAELSQSNLFKEYERVPEYEAEEDAPIDVNLNLVKNFLESYASQAGMAGPVSNILSEINQT